MEERNKDIVIDGQQETLLFQDVCSIIEHGRRSSSCMHFINVILKQCQIENVPIHNIYFDKEKVIL